MKRRITVKIETEFSDTHFTNFSDGREISMTDADLKSFAIDEFIMDLTRTCEEKNLRRYIQVSFNPS
jgi:hypothetical protein